jgi:hypothetical protein
MVFAHRQTPTLLEEISLRQCSRIFKNRDIFLITPNGLDSSAYLQLCPTARVLTLNPTWFTSLASYNKLKISTELYKTFRNFDWVLTYELDSFVFRDELDYWCEQSFDYIGAPWFEGFLEASPNAPVMGVGNSGFSLRRTKSCLAVVKSCEYNSDLFSNYSQHKRTLTGHLYGLRLRSFLRNLKNVLCSKSALKHFRGAEDIFWCRIIPSRFPEFRLATIDQAMHFSFEFFPSRLYEETGKNIPFGCHKWYAYEPEFWIDHIRSFGHSIPSDVCSKLKDC